MVQDFSHQQYQDARPFSWSWRWMETRLALFWELVSHGFPGFFKHHRVQNLKKSKTIKISPSPGIVDCKSLLKLMVFSERLLNSGSVFGTCLGQFLCFFFAIETSTLWIGRKYIYKEKVKCHYKGVRLEVIVTS